MLFLCIPKPKSEQMTTPHRYEYVQNSRKVSFHSTSGNFDTNLNELIYRITFTIPGRRK